VGVILEACNPGHDAVEYPGVICKLRGKLLEDQGEDGPAQHGPDAHGDGHQVGGAGKGKFEGSQSDLRLEGVRIGWRKSDELQDSLVVHSPGPLFRSLRRAARCGGGAFALFLR